jgi:hypothetical protein
MVKKVPILLKGGSSINGENINIILILIVILLLWVIYLLNEMYRNKNENDTKQKISITNNISKKTNELLLPPLKNDNNYYYGNPNIEEMPIQVRTRGGISNYSQVGILTKDESDKYPLILPLMGRRVDRNKMQYYAISNTGSMNTKLPLKRKGRSCTEERGCDELFSGDEIFVEGYKASFKTTVYENTYDFSYTA